MNLSKYFSLAEFTRSASHPQIPNQPGSAELTAMQALCQRVLDPLREAVGAPVGVSSGYRGPALNRKVGGVANSQHRTGQAADLQSPAVSALALFKAVIRLGLPFDQAIYEDKSPRSRWLHVSHNTAGNRGQLLLATFTGGKARYTALTAEQALALPERLSRGMRGSSDGAAFEELNDEPPPSVSAAVVVGSAAPTRRRSRSACAGDAQIAAAIDAAPAKPKGSPKTTGAETAATPSSAPTTRAAAPKERGTQAQVDKERPTTAAGAKKVKVQKTTGQQSTTKTAAVKPSAVKMAPARTAAMTKSEATAKRTPSKPATAQGVGKAASALSQEQPKAAARKTRLTRSSTKPTATRGRG